MAAACGGTAEGPLSPPTFARDISPIVDANCAPCHRPGNIAPFSLLTYEDVRDHAGEILPAVESREMPPWLPDQGRQVFANARGLNDTQIEILRRWVESGTPAGTTQILPREPRNLADDWPLGKPDLVVTFKEAYTLAAGTTDEFRNFVVPVDVPHTVFVRGVDFRPNDPKAVHHAVIGVDASGESRRLDAEDAAPGYAGMFADEFHSPDGHFVGWTPGRSPMLEPENTAWRLDPGTDLVVQIHMLPGEDARTVRPQIGLYFTERTPDVVPFMVKLTSTTIDIPPGASDYSVGDEYTLPVDVQAVSIYPHAHYLGRTIRATATLPSGEERVLLSIRNWDFHWQELYRYAEPLSLPRGTRLAMRIGFDNSSGHQPTAGQAPRRVKYGPRSSDEMADVWLQVVPRQRGDLPVLASDFIERRNRARIVAGEVAVRERPNDAGAHDLLGTRYLAANRVEAAIREFSEALRLQPDYPEARNNIGAALVTVGRSVEAVRHLRMAAKARPQDARVQFNLGNALRDSGHVGEATLAFERALALSPASPDVLNNLAALDGARGEFTRAIDRLRRALALREDYADAHHNLALALAATGQRNEAIEHARRAVALRPDFESAKETLADLERGR
jgi:Flp pilus assembly protein TadD